MSRLYLENLATSIIMRAFYSVLNLYCNNQAKLFFQVVFLSLLGGDGMKNNATERAQSFEFEGGDGLAPLESCLAVRVILVVCKTHNRSQASKNLY